MTVLTLVRDTLEKRAAYLSTKRELRKLPTSVCDDIGINRENAADIASKAVYG